jgi:surface antigen
MKTQLKPFLFLIALLVAAITAYVVIDPYSAPKPPLADSVKDLEPAKVTAVPQDSLPESPPVDSGKGSAPVHAEQRQVDATEGVLAGQPIGRDTESTLLGVGNEMDKYDRQMLNRSYENAPSNKAKSWINPYQGTQYQITPQSPYQNANNQWCRKAEIRTTIDGSTRKTYTTACRDKYGNWQIQQ